mgnify:CR=1 FL=1
MRTRIKLSAMALLAAGGTAPALLDAQTAANAAPASEPAAAPRTSWGDPDLQGVWDYRTITPLERLRPNTPLVLSEEQAREEERKTAAGLEAREAPSDPNRGAPPVGGEVRKSPNAEPTYLELLWRAGGGAVGGYNSFWVDPGDKVLRVDGHTDVRPVGGGRTNWDLSAARAIAVVQYLISKGISPQRLVAAGFGEFQPIDTGTTEEAYARNRRIELKLTDR